eukprot:jgi/Botrbrau1/11552/Bobra.60_1s0006.1
MNSRCLTHDTGHGFSVPQASIRRQHLRSAAPDLIRHRHAAARQRKNIIVKVSAEDVVETKPVEAEAPTSASNFVPVIRPEDLPKGSRKEVRVEGINILLFWYRNQIMAIEARSPAEGAYSEGFLNAKLTQVMLAGCYPSLQCFACPCFFCI